MAAAKAFVRLRHTVVTDTRGEQQLFLELHIKCEACGLTDGVIAGHHLKALHGVLGRLVAQYPDLCGNAAEQLEDQSLFSGTVDPKTIRNN